MEILEFIKELAVGNAVGLWGMIFAVVLLASIIEYKLSGKPEKKGMGVLGGALLGLVPGCGGTIAVTSLYTKRKASFSAVLASFVATLGDGSFSLIAIDVKAFIIVSIVGFFLGLIVGYGYDLLMPESAKPVMKKPLKNKFGDARPIKTDFQADLLTKYLFWPLIILGVIFLPLSLLDVTLGVIEAFGGTPFLNIDEIMANGFIEFTGILSMILVIVYWLADITIRRRHDCRCRTEFNDQVVHGLRDSAMIMAIIMISTAIFGLIIEIGIGIETFNSFIGEWGIMLIVFAAFMGALPGCAPFVVLTVFVGTIYETNGEMLWGVLITGTIATSGDGIFGLASASRRTALYITGISIALAIVVGIPTYLIFG